MYVVLVTAPTWRTHLRGGPNAGLHIFSEPSGCLSISSLYIQVLLVDSTYNTNYARLSLFENLGVDTKKKDFLRRILLPRFRNRREFARVLEQLSLSLAHLLDTVGGVRGQVVQI